MGDCGFAGDRHIIVDEVGFAAANDRVGGSVDDGGVRYPAALDTGSRIEYD